LLPLFKPGNDFEVRQALIQAGRQDLIGSGCDALIPIQPPKAALKARREQANRVLEQGGYVHTIPGAQSTVAEPPGLSKDEFAPRPVGYRPKRKSARRRPR
jgi:hypothetical protein